MRHLIFLILLFLLIGCGSKHNADDGPSKEETLETSFIDTAIFVNDTTIDFYSFTMKVPHGWRKANDDSMPAVGDATYRKRLHNKENKLVYILSGLGAWDVSDDPETKTNTQKTYYEQITGLRAKYFEPIRSEQGFSGLYIDSIGNFAGNTVRLCIYSENPDSLENSELMKIIRTIKIKPEPFH